MVDFSKLLSKPLDDIEKPKPLPTGTYTAVIEKYEVKEIGKNKTPAVTFTLKALAPTEDIDPSDLEGVKLEGRKMSTNFFLTEDAQYRLKEFLIKLGLDTAGRMFNELLPETTNQPVQITVSQRIDGENIYNDVQSITAAA